MTNWAGFSIDKLSATADGKRFTFRELMNQYKVYVADLEDNGTRIKSLRKLTTSEGGEVPWGWAPDGKSVVFFSSLNGRGGIFKQAPGEDSAEPILGGLPANLVVGAYLTPDRASVLYVHGVLSSAEGLPLERAGTQVQLMRVSLTGGPPQLVLTSASFDWYRCTMSPSTFCVIGEWTPDRRHLILTAFDPVKGRGQELTRLDADPSDDYDWDISPDGTRIAVLKHWSVGPIRILSLSGQLLQEIALNGRRFEQPTVRAKSYSCRRS